MAQQIAYIVIDTGFSAESLSGAPVVGFYDLLTGRTAGGEHCLDHRTLMSFAGDPSGHGSAVLARLRRLAPEAPLVLIRAFDGDTRLIRTTWEGGRQRSCGWTEAYIWAVQLCQ